MTSGPGIWTDASKNDGVVLKVAKLAKSFGGIEIPRKSWRLSLLPKKRTFQINVPAPDERARAKTAIR